MHDEHSASAFNRRDVLAAAAGIAAALGIAVAPAKARAARPAGEGWPYDGLRDWTAMLEDRGLLLRVPRVDQDRYELTALAYRLVDEFGWYGMPAVLAEEVRQNGRWFRGPVLTNHQGHWDTEALLWGLEPVEDAGRETYRKALDHCTGLVAQGNGRLGTLPPIEVPAAKAPVKEVVLRGNEVNLLDFPFLKSNPGDSGRFVNTGSVFTTDPEMGQNFGTYRCEIKGQRRLGVNSEPGQTGFRMFMAQIDRGEKRTPVAIVLGQDPMVWQMSATAASKGRNDELAIAGFLRGKPVDVVACETVDFRVPAHAEMVIEGEVLLDEMEPEGPFGEMYGYLGLRKERNFVMQVNCVTHRRNPWIVNQFTGVTRGFCSALPEASGLYRLRKAVPEVVAYHSPAGLTGWGFLAIDKQKPGQGLDAGRRVMQLLQRNKIIAVVDRDVDVHNFFEVFQAIGARWQPYPGATISEKARGNPLDPSVRDRPMSSNIVIDATKQWPEEGGPDIYPERNRDLLAKLAPESFGVVRENWDRYLRGWRNRS